MEGTIQGSPLEWQRLNTAECLTAVTRIAGEQVVLSSRPPPPDLCQIISVAYGYPVPAGPIDMGGSDTSQNLAGRRGSSGRIWKGVPSQNLAADTPRGMPARGEGGNESYYPDLSGPPYHGSSLQSRDPMGIHQY